MYRSSKNNHVSYGKILAHAICVDQRLQYIASLLQHSLTNKLQSISDES